MQIAGNPSLTDSYNLANGVSQTKILHCPSAVVNKGAGGNHNLQCYALNGLMWFWDGTALGFIKLNSNPQYFWDFNKIDRGTVTKELWVLGCSRYDSNTEWSYVNGGITVAYRHKGSTSVLKMDGSVNAMKPNEVKNNVHWGSYFGHRDGAGNNL